jgi:4'-phosphopantetheinyl transferase EntD
VGIDIERISSRVERIADRFTHASEMAYIEGCDTPERLLRLLINWSAKETLYKCVDTPSAADFKNTFQIAPYEMAPQGRLSVANMSHEVHFSLFPDFVCTWALL